MATLRWDSVNVWVDLPRQGVCSSRQRKQIIHSSSGIIRQGQILAVIGPSGAGKTSLFNVLSKRDQAYDVEGSLKLNGVSYDPDVLKMVSGFVWQEALFHSHLTPREALMFAARLKLPSSVTPQDRKERVESLLKAFDLERCAETRIGNESVKGISGGEKKRLSIAIEVLARPKLLFLDEPTSGLDATSSYRIMSLLRILADAGTTIVTTLHQPRPGIARAIDRFLVLSAGHQVFFGPLEAMLDHFSNLGFTCPPGENPLDYMLDLINNESEDGGFAGEETRKMLQVQNHKPSKFQLERLPSAVMPGQTRTELAADLAAKFWRSGASQGLLDALPEDSVNEPFVVSRRGGFQSTWLARLSVVMHREFLQKIRNPQVGATQLMAALVMGTIMGTFYYKERADVQLINNALAFVFMFTVFFSFHLVLFFPKERHIHVRDFSQGIMGSSEYYFGMVLTDLPMTTLAAISFATIFYFMVDLPAGSFGGFLGIVTLSAITGGALLLAAGAFSPDPATANSIVSLIFLFCMFLNGYFAISPPAWSWIETINYLRFVTMASFRNQWDGYVFDCNTTSPACPFTNGTQVLQAYGVPNVSIGTWCGYTVACLCAFHLVGLAAISFLYNGRIQNAVKRWKEKRAEKNSTVVIANGLSEEAFDRQVIKL